MRLLAFLLLPLLAAPALAQNYPEPPDTGIADLAALIDDETEAALAGEIAQLEDEHGVEIAVVTLSSRADYADETQDIRQYTDALFDQWGVGSAEDNDGILLAVYAGDNNLFVSLGDGYTQEDGEVVEDIIDNTIVPRFRAGDFNGGIADGTRALIARVATPPAPDAASVESAATEEAEGGGGGLWWLLALLGIPIAGFWYAGRRSAAKLAATPCSVCGKTGLTRERVTVKEPTVKDEGLGETRLTCPHCGNVDRDSYTIGKLDPPEPDGEFKGGKSGDEGAAGKW